MRPWQRLTISDNWNHLSAYVIWNILVWNIKGKINKIAINGYSRNGSFATKQISTFLLIFIKILRWDNIAFERLSARSDVLSYNIRIHKFSIVTFNVFNLTFLFSFLIVGSAVLYANIGFSHWNSQRIWVGAFLANMIMTIWLVA